MCIRRRPSHTTGKSIPAPRSRAGMTSWPMSFLWQPQVGTFPFVRRSAWRLCIHSAFMFTSMTRLFSTCQARPTAFLFPLPPPPPTSDPPLLGFGCFCRTLDIRWTFKLQFRLQSVAPRTLPVRISEWFALDFSTTPPSSFGDHHCFSVADARRFSPNKWRHHETSMFNHHRVLSCSAKRCPPR